MDAAAPSNTNYALENDRLFNQLAATLNGCRAEFGDVQRWHEQMNHAGGSRFVPADLFQILTKADAAQAMYQQE